jgi:hypothetical protein
MHTFGTSAPLKELQKKFGFEPNHVVAVAKELLRKKPITRLPRNLCADNASVAGVGVQSGMTLAGQLNHNYENRSDS